MQVQYLRNGRSIAATEAPGRLLTPFLPYGLTLEAAPGGFVIHEPGNRSITGQLTLPYYSGHNLEFVDLEVPSNGRFSQEDLRRLWEAGTELAVWQQARIALARHTGTFGAPEVIGYSERIRDWHSLELCARDAGALLSRWPSQLDRRSIWLPVGVPGGIEDLPLTEMDAQELGYLVESGDRVSVSRSARWVGDQRRLRSAAVSAMASAVIDVVRRTVPRTEWTLITALVNPIAMVAQFAATPAGHRDPDPSSWPIPFRTFVASCMRAIADLQSEQRGRGVVPLVDTDELYEAWLAVQARDALDVQLGYRVDSGSDALAAWRQNDILYELWVKPGINRKGRMFGNATFVALVADILTPDLILSASRDDETTLFVLDAKSWAIMLPEDALAQSAKYLYGLRRIDDLPETPAICGVDLVTSAVPPVAPHTEVSRVRVLGATPTSGIGELHTRLSEIVLELTSEIESRERAASAY